MKRKLTFLVLMCVLFFLTVNIETASAQWTSAGPEGGYIKGTARSGSTIYALMGWGGTSIYTSADNGNNWTFINTTLPTDVRAIAVMGNSLFIATVSGIYRSDDNGITWVNKSAGFPAGTSLYMTTLAATGTTIFAAIQVSTPITLIRSTDNGETWTLQTSGLTCGGINTILATETAVFTGGGSNKKGVFRSTNNGDTWQQVKNGMYYYQSGTPNYAYAPNINALGFNGTDLYTGTLNSQGVWKTSDNGDNWVLTNTSTRSNATYSSVVGDGSTVYAGTGTNGILRSTDNGANWISSNNGIDVYGEVRSLMVSAGSVLAGTKAGIYRTANSGADWIKSSSGIKAHQMANLVVLGSDIFVGTVTGGVLKSSDEGNSWTAANNGLPININFGTYTLRSNSTTLFAYDRTSVNSGTSWEIPTSPGLGGYYIEHGTARFAVKSYTDAGVYRSMDNGASWTLVNNGISSTPELVVNIFSDGTTLYVGTDVGYYYSTDNGDNWIPGIFPDFNLWSFNGASFVSDGAISIMGLIGGGGQQGIFRTIDHGANWTQVSDLLVHKLILSGTRILASGSGSDGHIVLLSQDNGLNWNNITSNLNNIYSFSMAAEGPNTYVATGLPVFSVYRSTNNGTSWVNISDGLDPNIQTLGLEIVNTKIYACSNGRSMWQRNLDGFVAPAQPGAISGSTTPCIGSTQIYSVTNVPGVNYVWQFPSVWTVLSGNGTNEVNVLVGSIGGIVIVTPSNQFGSGPAQATFITPSSPVPTDVTIIASNNPTCPGTTVTFTATPVNGGSPSYQWFVNSIAVGDDISQFSYIPVNEDEVCVEMTSSLGCVTNNPASSNTIVMSVIACQPWNFTITGQVHTINIPTSANPNINGEPLAAGDWIGVFFVDGNGIEQCAGAVQWNLQGSVINAYGNDPTTPEKDGFAANETFNWKMFEMSTSTEFSAGATYDVSMPNQGKFADFGLSKLTSLQVMYCQSYTFTTGWNSVSSYIVPFNPAVENLFAPMVNNLTILRNLTQLYWPSEGVNTIGNFDNQSGYAIKTTGNVSFEICGATFASSEIVLEAGWHYLPVLSECPANTMDLFGAHFADIVIVTDLIGSQVFWPAMEVYSLEYLQPGKAYKIKVLNPFTLIFPACNGKANYPAFDQLNSISTPWGNLEITPNAQTVAITTNAQAEMLKGDMVGAFDQNNKLCGFIEVPANGQPTAMILIGDDATTTIKDGFAEGENISYRIFRANTGEEFSLEVVYDAGFDNATGNYFTSSLSAINAVTMSVTGINNIGTSGISIYPNPATDFVVINIATENFAGATVTVNDTKGRTVIEKMIGSSNSKLDISNLRSGVYVISIKSDSINEISKLIVR